MRVVTPLRGLRKGITLAFHRFNPGAPEQKVMAEIYLSLRHSRPEV